VSLEQQFKWFALDHAAEAGLFDHVAQHGFATENHEDHSVKTASDAVSSLAQDAQCEEHKGVLPGEQEEFEEQKKISLIMERSRYPERLNVKRLKSHVHNFLLISNAVMGDQDLRIHWFPNQTIIDGKNTTDPKYKSKSSSVSDYLAWKKAQVTGSDWEKAVEKQFADAFKYNNDTGDQRIKDKLKETLEVVTDLHDRLSEINSHIQVYQEMEWTISPKRLLNEAVDFIEDYIGTTMSNTNKGIKRAWNFFKHKLQSLDKECVAQTTKDKVAEESHIENKLQQMNASGLLDDDSGSNASMTQAMDALQDANETMEKFRQRLETEAKPIADRAKELKDLRDAEEYGYGDNVKEQKKNMEKVKQKLAEVNKAACANKSGGILSKLQTAASTIKSTLSGSFEYMTPVLGNRGIGGSATVMQGGIEEVVDFWNREIGYFHFGGAQFGMNILTAGIGAYAGLAWKGYKMDWTLEEAYQTALWVAGSFPLIPAFLAPFAGSSASMCFAIDADNSNGVPWIAEVNGCNGFTVGYGFGVGADYSLGAVLGGNSVGHSVYKMFRSECFDQEPMRKFITAIWMPWCTTCKDVSPRETAMIGALRSAIHLVSYKGFTDAIFTAMAFAVNHIRKNGENDAKRRALMCKAESGDPATDCPEKLGWDKDAPRCSEKSTRFAAREVNSLSDIANKLKTSVQMLEEINNGWQEMKKDINAAVGAYKNKKGRKKDGRYKGVQIMDNLQSFLDGLTANNVRCKQGPIESNLLLVSQNSLELTDLSRIRKETDDAKLEEHIAVMINMCRFHMTYRQEEFVAGNLPGQRKRVWKDAWPCRDRMVEKGIIWKQTTWDMVFGKRHGIRVFGKRDAVGEDGFLYNREMKGKHSKKWFAEQLATFIEESKQEIVSKTRKTGKQDFYTIENQFGACTDDQDCAIAYVHYRCGWRDNKTLDGGCHGEEDAKRIKAEALKSRQCHFQKHDQNHVFGRCGCRNPKGGNAEGFCYNSDTKACEKYSTPDWTKRSKAIQSSLAEDAKAQLEAMDESLNIWTASRQIEIGGLVRTLAYVSSVEGDENDFVQALNKVGQAMKSSHEAKSVRPRLQKTRSWSEHKEDLRKSLSQGHIVDDE